MAAASWTGKSVLVTGAGGFIGSHLVEQLVLRGARTRALVHYNGAGSWGWLDESPQRAEVEVLLGDVCDPGRMREAVRGVDAVFHLAALIAIPYSYHAPESYVRTNVLGTLNVLEAVRDAGTARLVHTSTSEVYGTAQYVPIDERHPLQGQSPYSATKIGADKLVESYHRSFGLPAVTVRPFNTYGPRQSARAVIPTVITQGLAGGAVRLGSLSPTRDFNYVADTVEGFLAAAAAPDAVGATINIGSGREIAIGDLVALVGRLLGREIEVQAEAERVRPAGSEVERLLADNTLAGSLLGWQPAHTLEAGLEQTIAWLRDHQSRYRTSAYSI